MRPYQTIILVALAILAVVYFTLREQKSDPRIDRFVDCYVELAILHQSGDTAASIYNIQKDSVLARFDFNEESFLALKNELNRDPDKLVDVYILIEERLKERREALKLTQ